MSYFLRCSAAAVLLTGLLATDASTATAAPYDDYGFYLLDTPSPTTSNNQRRTSQARFQSSGYRARSTRAVTYCPPTRVVTVGSLSPTQPINSPSNRIAGSPDRATVAKDSTSVMLGQNVVQRVSAGSVVEVVEIRGPWVGVQVENQEENSAGWIRREELQLISTEN